MLAAMTAKHYPTQMLHIGMVGGDDGVTLVEVSWLKAHEEIKHKNRDKLLEMTKRWGGYTRPLLVDSKTGAILDGHHRYSVAIELGLNKVPAIVVDYLNDESIRVDVWPTAIVNSLRKQEVIDMSLSDQLFPPKTSRHSHEADIPPIHVSLEDLK